MVVPEAVLLPTPGPCRAADGTELEWSNSLNKEAAQHHPLHRIPVSF